MRSPFRKALSGVTLVGPDVRRQTMKLHMRGDYDAVFAGYAENCLRTAKLARRLGAEVLTLPLDDSNALDGRLQARTTFTFGQLPGDVMVDAQERLRALGPADGLRRPATKLLRDCTEDDLHQFPYVLANTGANRGIGKYLIESSIQADAILRAREDHSVFSAPDYEVREYVPTPGNRYTSVRVNTSPVGEALAAEVIYSGQLKDKTRIITASPVPYDPRPGKHSDVEGYFGVTPENLFENPDSSYFLGARDVRSNLSLSTAGGSIPILGGKRRRISAEEGRMLDELQIEPNAESLPGDIQSQIMLTAGAADRKLGLATGDDFVYHATEGQFYYLETNASPGLGTYETCWADGQRIGDVYAGVGLDALALDSIARWHAGK